MRDRSLDALRGLAIVLVIIGHAFVLQGYQTQGGAGMVSLNVYWVPAAIAASPVNTLIATFHMPLFAFVSGLVMWPPRKTGLVRQIAKRFRGLMVPYFAWGVVLWVAAVLIPTTALAPVGKWLDELHLAILGGGLWFLYALFIAVVALLCVMRLPGSRWLVPASAVFAIVWSTGKLVAVPSVAQMANVLWLYPFVVMGYMVAPHADAVRRRRWLIAVLGVAAFLPLAYVRHPLFVPDQQHIHALMTWMQQSGVPGRRTFVTLVPYACAAAATFALYALYSGRTGRLIDLQAWLGKRSLGIYASHTAIMMYFVGLGVHSFFSLFALSLGLSVLLIFGIERVPVVCDVFLGHKAAPRQPHLDGALESAQ